MDQKKQANSKSKRKFVRFVRDDIQVSMIKINLIGLKETIECKLVDISSTGAQISTTTKLGSQDTLILRLKFLNGRSFRIKTKLMRHKIAEHYLSNHSFDTVQELNKIPPDKLENLIFFQSDEEIYAKYRKLTPDSVKVLTYTPVKKRQKCTLLFKFVNGQLKNVESKINNIQHFQEHFYGLKFDKTNDTLADHLFETEQDLIFQT